MQRYGLLGVKKPSDQVSDFNSVRIGSVAWSFPNVDVHVGALGEALTLQARNLEKYMADTDVNVSDGGTERVSGVTLSHCQTDSRATPCPSGMMQRENTWKRTPTKHLWE